MKSKSVFRIFALDIVLTLMGLGLAWYLGYSEESSIKHAFEFVFLASVLALLEVTISFDNAIINASVLRDMTPLWQRRFLTWGILIAVFGMRLVFPIVIVCVAAGIGPIAAVKMALLDQKHYADIMLSVHPQVSAFGGSFLALVCLSYFFNSEKETHWLTFIERRLTRLGALKSTEIAVMLGALWLFSNTLEADNAYSVFKAGIAGVLTFILVKLVGEMLSLSKETEKDIHRQSFGMFLYLEVLDASFSFDGVVAAFAITVNPFIIAIGLGIGALFVRSFTILMVEKGTLEAYKYLEHGAFWAIGVLAAFMFTSVHYHLPEVVIGGVSLALITAAFVHSVLAARKDAKTN